MGMDLGPGSRRDRPSATPCDSGPFDLGPSDLGMTTTMRQQDDMMPMGVPAGESVTAHVVQTGSTSGGGERIGQVAVIFLSQRCGGGDDAYHAAAIEMERLAATQPGYRGVDSARGDDGLGITVSYWADEAAAIAWRDDPEHRAIRDAGRGRWYDGYRAIVCTVTRAYEWTAA
jgi:heme-degrading monooxygenase HmoA